ncbi:MAG: hypothetical protein KC421_15605 [Anaerolineales bacterium]|nr:hypothetical protein [Anaerolineales bacterium]
MGEGNGRFSTPAIPILVGAGWRGMDLTGNKRSRLCAISPTLAVNWGEMTGRRRRMPGEGKTRSSRPYPLIWWAAYSSGRRRIIF